MSEELKVITLDVATGEVTETVFTPEEVEEFETSKTARQAELEAKEAVRSSALAKLAALGLTEEEIAAL